MFKDKYYDMIENMIDILESEDHMKVRKNMNFLIINFMD